MFNSNTPPSFPFPLEWEKENERAVFQYEYCGSYYENAYSLINHYSKENSYHIICFSLLAYIIIGCYLILKYRKTFEISKYNLSMIMLYSFGVIITISSTYLNQVL